MRRRALRVRLVKRCTPRGNSLFGVNYFFCLTTIISPDHSSLLLPSAARCLMKNVTHPNERDGGQIEEAIERDNETGTD
jgi:hypothetical protein